MAIIRALYHLLWGDLITIPLPGGRKHIIAILPMSGQAVRMPEEYNRLRRQT